MTFFIVLLIAISLITIYGRSSKLHLFITIGIYLLLAYVWIDAFIPKEDMDPKHNCFPLFILNLYVSPILAVYHICCIVYARYIGNIAIKKINLVGLALCTLNLLIFFTLIL